MGVTSPERSALEQLSAARRRGDAKPDELLELAEAAVDQAADAADALSLEKIAAELESAAPAYPEPEGGLRLRFAATRVRATSLRPPAAPEDVPQAARVAFWVTVWVTVLTLFSLGAVAALGDVSASYVLVIIVMFAVVIGFLVAAVTGAVGLVQSLRAGSRKGMLMSAVALAVVLVLVVVRIVVSF